MHSDNDTETSCPSTSGRGALASLHVPSSVRTSDVANGPEELVGLRPARRMHALTNIVRFRELQR